MPPKEAETAKPALRRRQFDCDANLVAFGASQRVQGKCRESHDKHQVDEEKEPDADHEDVGHRLISP